MKIDAFCHIVPPKFKKAIEAELGSLAMVNALPTMFDLEARFRVMDHFDDLMQVLTVSLPPLETINNKQKAVDLAKIANDEMAELIIKYPDRFAAAIACLPMNDIDNALLEVDRVVNDLKFRGIQIFTPVNDKALDSPEFFPLYEKMCQYNLPIFIHPTREADYPDYRTEKFSQYGLMALFGWVYETSTAMMRLIYSGVMEKYPGLKFITHHAGAMVPFLEKRVVGFADFAEMRLGSDNKKEFRQHVLEYVKMFYVDTAIYGNTPGLMCSYATYGARHMLFATDFPYDNQFGLRYTRATIDSVSQMNISEAEKNMIFQDNARDLLRLPV